MTVLVTHTGATAYYPTASLSYWGGSRVGGGGGGAGGSGTAGTAGASLQGGDGGDGLTLYRVGGAGGGGGYYGGGGGGGELTVFGNQLGAAGTGTRETGSAHHVSIANFNATYMGAAQLAKATIARAAFYGSALSATRIANHYSAGA